ncbi:unnamed protein product [marine sediment metagenome]|uniref:Uncharacterized protein n=1 Tax=marine sediment metagenome TaxID=412755 RepID=X1AZZ5_9ZZZZ
MKVIYDMGMIQLTIALAVIICIGIVTVSVLADKILTWLGK